VPTSGRSWAGACLWEVVAAAVLCAISAGDDGEDLVDAGGVEFELRIHGAIGVGCDLAAPLRGSYAVWASLKGERGSATPHIDVREIGDDILIVHFRQGVVLGQAGYVPPAGRSLRQLAILA
jgi:hypothetical protein